MEESGQPRWFWEPEQAVMAGASSNLATQTYFVNMLVKCEYCGKEFEKELRRVNESISRGWKHYCSKECRLQAKTVKIKCKCAQCGIEIEKLPSEIKNSKYGNVFCSKNCACSYNNSHFRTNENNPNWKGEECNSYRELAFRLQEHKCAVCGFDIEAALQVHHIMQ